MFLFCCEILLWSIKYLPIYAVLSKKWLYLLVLFSFNLLFSTYDYITLPDTDPGRDHSPQTNTASEILQLLKAAPLPHKPLKNFQIALTATSSTSRHAT